MTTELKPRPTFEDEPLDDGPAQEPAAGPGPMPEATPLSYEPCRVSVETLRSLGVTVTAATRDHLRYGHSVAEFTD